MFDEIISQAKNQLNNINKLDLDKLARTNELGTSMGFAEIVEYAEDTREVFNNFNNELLEKLPQNYCQQILGKLKDFESLLGSVMAFDVNQGNAAQARENLVHQFKDFSIKIKQQLAPHIAYILGLKANTSDLYEIELEKIKLKEKEFENLINKKEIELKNTLDKVNKTQDELEQVKSEFSEISRKLQEDAGKASTSKEAIHFKQEARNYIITSYINLTIIILLSICLIATLFAINYFLIPDNADPNKFTALNYMTNKILIIGLIAYLLKTSVKSYLSSLHNSTVNRHRQNALLTYDTLFNGAHSPETKDKILEAASACIYSHQETGYVKQSAGNNNSLMEIVPKTIIQTKDTG